jgi:lysophospholipase L1-like esterase
MFALVLNGSRQFLRKGTLLFILLVMMSSFIQEDKSITIYMIGDSTMADKEVQAYPETGWGTPFKVFFNSSVKIENRSKNGRSTKSFREEGLWQPVYDNLKEGDYVFIQFGHNDEGKEKVGRYTTPEEFKQNLERYINESKTKRAIPVLLTPVSRRKFENGKMVETHPVYSDVVREVAKERKVAFIDMDKKSQALYQQFGEENSKWLFLQLDPGVHPNYPDGRNDNTHFSELGARLIAQLVLAEIRQLDLSLNTYVVNKKAN